MMYLRNTNAIYCRRVAETKNFMVTSSAAMTTALSSGKAKTQQRGQENWLGDSGRMYSFLIETDVWSPAAASIPQRFF